MDDGLVDLSLFAVSPTHDHHFTVYEIPSLESLSQDNSRSAGSHGAPRREDRSRTMKPLPPIPRYRCAAFRPGPRCDGASRCILSRLRRSRSNDDENNGSVYQATSIQQRRNAHPTPQLTLSTPQQTYQGRSPNVMVWMPDEQVWLVLETSSTNNYNTGTDPDEPPPSYYAPSYAHSEPSPRLSSPEVSPVRGQLMSLIQRRERNSTDMTSPRFQEAIHSVSMQDFGHSSEPPSFRIERDWQYEESMTDNWDCDVNSGEDLADLHHCACCERARWQQLGRDIHRPRSAL